VWCAGSRRTCGTSTRVCCHGKWCEIDLTQIPLVSDGGPFLWDLDEEDDNDEGLGDDKKRRNPYAGSAEDGKKRGKKRKANEADPDDPGGTGKKGKSVVKTEDGYASDASDLGPLTLLTQDTDSNTTYAYRAIRPEYPQSVLGWSQTPCGRCPVFDFCTAGGPVNAAECVYFDMLEQE
jgi:DNA-directed RNA polymerase III subunit RPC6